MIKSIAASVAVHFAAVLLIYAALGHWGGVRALNSRVLDQIELDVMVIGEKSGSGLRKEKVQMAKKAPQVKAPQSKPPQSKPIEPAEESVAPPVANAESTSGATEVASAPTQVVIEGDGKPLRLTESDYVRWVMTHNEPPEYPRIARIRNEQGRALVRVVVPARGSPVERVELMESSGFDALDRSAMEAVDRWRFPAFQGADRLVLPIPFRFSLEQ